VKGKNIGGYIWGKNSNNPLVLVTSYDYLGKDSKGLYKNGTSVAAILELARNLRAKSKENMNSRTIVFLFTDGSEQNGQGVIESIGNKNIDVYSFYVYMNYLGLGESQNDLSKIDKEKFKEQSQLVLDFAVDYAWISNWKDRGLKACN